METAPRIGPSARAWRWLALIVAVQIVLGVLFALTFPPLENQDEIFHWDYVRYLRENRRLPDQREPYIQENTGQFFQPPLYYLTAALITAPIPSSNPPMTSDPWNEFGLAYPRTSIPDNANHILHDPDNLVFPGRGDWLSLDILRLFSVLLGALSTIAGFWLAWLVFENDGLALGAASWLGLRPSPLSLNSAMSNDPLLLLLGTAILALCALIVARGPTWRRAALLGFLLGAAALTKYTWVATAAAVPAAFVLAPGWRERWRQSLAQLALAGGSALLMVSWWIVRNLLLYGDLTGLRLDQAALGQPISLPVRLTPISAEEVEYWGYRFFKDYWAAFGVRGMPERVNKAFVVLTVLLLAGLVYLLVSGRLRRRVGNYRVSIFVLGVSALYMLQLVVMFTIVTNGFKARYAYAGYASFAIASHLGLLGLLDLAAKRWPRSLSLAPVIPALLMVPLSLYGLFGILRPAYGLPRRVEDPARLAGSYDTPADVRFGETIRLIGYSLDRRALQPGDALHVTLCWESGGPLEEALPYGIHIVDDQDRKAAELNTHPGLGMYATLYWEPGVYFCDRARVPIEGDAPAPRAYRVVLKYFHLDTLEVVPATLADGQQVEFFTLAEIALVPPDWPDSGEPLYLVGDALAITDLTLSSDTLAPGQTPRVDVQWRALSPPGRDYTAFVHILDQDGELVAQTDTRPRDGTFPTLYWPEGAVVDDQIEVPAFEGPPGTYRVRFGIYDTQTVTRLPLRDMDGRPLPDNVIELGTFETSYQNTRKSDHFR